MGSCEHSNKYSSSIKFGGFIDHLRDYQLLEDNSIVSYDNVTSFEATESDDELLK